MPVACGGGAQGTIVPGTVIDQVTPAMKRFTKSPSDRDVSITRVDSVDERDPPRE